MKTIQSLVRNSLLIGFGTAALTKEKAEKFVKEITKNQKINSTEGKKLVNDLLIQSKKQGEKLQTIVNKEVQRTINKIGIATKKDLKVLEKKISNLSKKKKKR
ncbi:phasin family protein [Candidatus Pacearchaeota archaeon]|nr:phasin family protein [Candidatus Pacearchaeota archaeon]